MINGQCPSYLRDKINLVQYEGALSARRDKVYIEKCLSLSLRTCECNSNVPRAEITSARSARSGKGNL